MCLSQHPKQKPSLALKQYLSSSYYNSKLLLKKNYKSLYSAILWRTIRCAVHMFHIAPMFKVHDALQFIVFIYF